VSALVILALAAEAYSAPLDLPKSAKVEFRVVRSRESVAPGKTLAPTSSTAVYEKTIETKDTGYRVTLKPVSLELPSAGPERRRRQRPSPPSPSGP
jgi:hypothetical protein